MNPAYRYALLRPVSLLAPDAVGERIAKALSGGLLREIADHATDRFLESLLGGMELAFLLSGEYRRNIGPFEGRYLFRTADGSVGASALFERGRMRMSRGEVGDWTARVTFRDAAGLRAFLFSRNRDILDSLLRNDVEVDGNLNHVYKFGFMARELSRKLGLG